MSEKHAYLIMAHNQPELLACLLKALDHADNDIYLHLDRKMPAFDRAALESQVVKGRLCILPERLDVKWGEYSQIRCELTLLAAASKQPHAYYHIMSGVDFPLKPQEQIHKFFRENAGTEFVQFYAPQVGKDVKNRVEKRHFFIKRRELKTLPEKIFGKLLMLLQLPMDRTRRLGMTLQKGANWCSITHELACYVLSREAFIRKTFRHSLCGDEVFLQTLVYNSEFRHRVVGENYCDNYRNICYLIDWDRGTPYEFTEEDYDLLMGSDMLFARKFNWNKDRKIVLRLLDAVTGGE